MTDYIAFRHQLHDNPQPSGDEQFAHDLIVCHLQSLHPTQVFTRVGGWGVMALWGQPDGRPTIALRADTDALPSGHHCGHDGHTTVLLRVAELVDEEWKTSGGWDHNVLLLWQPAEETGVGARAVIESGLLTRFHIVGIYGMHNLPGYPLGRVVLCENTFAAASTGVLWRLKGRETHASTPEKGINPGMAVAEIIEKMAALNGGAGDGFMQTTLIGVDLGSASFGTSAGQAVVMYTLRAYTDGAMAQLLADARAVVEGAAERYGLGVEQAFCDPFGATVNRPEHVEKIRLAAQQTGNEVEQRPQPFRWSEDFGEYLKLYPGAFFGMGSGERQPELHHPDYDFPDELIEPAARLFLQLARLV